MSASITEDVVIIRRKFLNLQVCAFGECSPELIERRTNQMDWAGTRHGWRITEDPELAPVPCDDDPARLHYILDC
jgi:hypothetical protein